MSKDGRPIIALPSTAKSGTISRIVRHLDEGAGVVTSRGDAHYVVTEWGIAYLHGSSVRQRALQLIQIAHPDFRAELLDFVRERYFIHVDDQAWEQLRSSYPSELEQNLELGGKTLFVRPLRISDERALQEFFYSHSPETVVQRYFYMKKELGQAEASMLCSVDYERRMALGAFDPDSVAPRLHAVVRYELDPRTNLAEPAVVVRESWQGKGLGSAMLGLLRKAAQARGISGFRSQVLATNGPMLQYHRKRGHDMQWDAEARVYRVLDRFEREPAVGAVDETATSV
jgi:GNAT superfamily N-acetyltransferase